MTAAKTTIATPGTKTATRSSLESSSKTSFRSKRAVGNKASKTVIDIPGMEDGSVPEVRPIYAQVRSVSAVNSAEAAVLKVQLTGIITKSELTKMVNEASNTDAVNYFCQDVCGRDDYSFRFYVQSRDHFFHMTSAFRRVLYNLANGTLVLVDDPGA